MAAPSIPRGIEVLVKKAAVDPDFRELLLKQRASAAAEIDLALDPSEAMMLNAVPAKQLEGIIDNTTVPQKQRSAFMGKVAAAMLLALGASIMTGCPVVTGSAPDRPVQNTEQADPSSDSETVKPVRPTNPGAKKGIRPDRPKSKK